MNFEDKVVLVTGASRGIGREIAQQFADRGANLIVHYNQNHAAAEETVRHLAENDHLICASGYARCSTNCTHGRHGRFSLRPTRHPDQQRRDF